MPEKALLREQVWRQLIDFIDPEELFFPFKIRKMINEEAHPILDGFLTLMIDRGMLVEFQQQSMVNKIAHWFYRFRIRKSEDKENMLEVYAKGPNWEAHKDRTFAQLAGEIEEEEDLTTH